MSTDSKEKKLPKGIRRRKSGLYEARFTYKGELYTLYNTNLKLLQKDMKLSMGFMRKKAM